MNPEDLKVQGRPPIYPWAEWFNGEAWELKQGVDFRCQPKSFRVLAHRTAREYGGKIRTKFLPHNTVALAFYDPDEP